MADFDSFVQGWNLNKGYYDHINEVIVGTDIAAYRDDPFAWRKFLRMVYRKIHRRLKEKSAIAIEELFAKLDSILDFSGLGADLQSQSVRKNRMADALLALDALEIMILDEMHDEDMLPTKVERVPPERAVEDFGW